MTYQARYIVTRDIDWFCRINGIWIHVASAGGELPNVINNRTQNIAIQSIVAELEDLDTPIETINFTPKNLREEIIWGEDENPIERDPLEEYRSLFKMMARRGFYSFDRINIDDFSDNKYRLVAYPISVH